MQEKLEINYDTWKKDYLKNLEADNDAVHNSQNFFYGKLLIKNFEAQFADALSSIKVDDKFIDLVHHYTQKLKEAYDFEWVKSEEESSKHPQFLEFIDKLHEHGFLIQKGGLDKKIALLNQILNYCDTDTLLTMGHRHAKYAIFWSRPDRLRWTLCSKKPDQFTLSFINSPGNLDHTEPSKALDWLTKAVPELTPYASIFFPSEGYTTLHCAQNVPMHVLESALKRMKAAVSISGKEKLPFISSEAAPALTTAQAVGSVGEKNQTFSYNDKEITFDKLNGTQVTLNPSDSFKKWFATLPLKTPAQLNSNYGIFKLNENTLAMNSGPGTPGIQIKRQGDSFIACNNQAADALPSARNANLVALLAGLNKALQPGQHQVKTETRPVPHLIIAIDSKSQEIAFIQQENKRATINRFKTDQSLSGSITLIEDILKCKRVEFTKLNGTIIKALGRTGWGGDHFTFGNVSSTQVEKLITAWKEKYTPVKQFEESLPIDDNQMVFDDKSTPTL